MIKRRRDWERRFAEAVKRREGCKFVYGKNDCFFFMASCFWAITGKSIAAPYRKRCTSRRAVFRVLKKDGGVENIVNSCMIKVGCAEVIPLKAQRGDVLVVTTETGSSAGVVGFDGRFGIFSDFNDISRVPIAKCTRAWRVG